MHLVANAHPREFGTRLALLSACQEASYETKESVMNRKALPRFALLIALIGIISGSSDAQTRRKVTLEAAVPFEFVVGNRAFPAGNYVFEMATGSPRVSEQSGVLVVRSHEHKLYASVATGVTVDTNAHVSPKLTFVRSGDRVFLSKVWRQGNLTGLSVPTAPGATEAEDWQESQVFTLDAMAMNGGI
jgi:hypothetical protein